MKTVDREKLWGEYQKNPSSALREKLITEYAPLVKVVAGRLSMYLGYNVEYEDLVSYGIFGLIDAIDKFDPGKDVKFETYASLRIRGSILDQIRKMDWIPRTVRQKQKRIEEAIKNIEARTGRAAADEEIAGEIGIAAAELNEWQSQLKVTNVVSLNEFVERGGEPVFSTGGAVLEGLSLEQIASLSRQWSAFNRRENPSPEEGEPEVHDLKKAWSTRLMRAFSGACSGLLGRCPPSRGPGR